MNKVITIPVGWTTEMCCTPSGLKLEFSPEDIARIKKVMQVVKDENLQSAKIEFEAEYFADEECTEESDFRSDVHQLIYPDCFYFYAQSKHDSSIQFESEELSIEEIEK